MQLGTEYLQYQSRLPCISHYMLDCPLRRTKEQCKLFHVYEIILHVVDLTQQQHIQQSFHDSLLDRSEEVSRHRAF